MGGLVLPDPSSVANHLGASRHVPRAGDSTSNRRQVAPSTPACAVRANAGGEKFPIHRDRISTHSPCQLVRLRCRRVSRRYRLLQVKVPKLDHRITTFITGILRGIVS